ncbi:uncharacterized protein LOC144565578 [Carex rostrata]
MDKFYQRVPKRPFDSSSSSNSINEVISNEQDPPSDPAQRKPILDYNPNERDRIRRYYLIEGHGPCQPHNHVFPQRNFSGIMRRFNPSWFGLHKVWLEYSIEKDATFCLCCYLFRPENLGSSGRTNFVGEGFRNWKKAIKSFEEHVGDSLSWHNQARKKCLDLMNQAQSIRAVVDKQTVRQEKDYRIQLGAIVDCVKFLCRQGLAFHGHDESESSFNEGNFHELLRFLEDHNEEIDKVIFDKAPQNLKLIAPTIQKDIVNACAEETTKDIIAELGDELFLVLIDEARDASTKEQMAVVIRFVNKSGSVVERFLGIVHVSDTTALCLKAALENLFGKHGLSLCRLRGQGYDGASNMSGEFNGLKALIMNENESAYYVHCFAHQLQLTLVAVANNHARVGLFFQMVARLLNVTGGSCKRRDQLRDEARINVVEAISSEEIVTGSGLKQESSLARTGDTRWSSHFNTLNSLVVLFLPTFKVIEQIEMDGSTWQQRSEACGLRREIQNFGFVFVLLLMRDTLIITHNLSQTLQCKSQDMVNAIRLVNIAKQRLQHMRDSGWELLLKKVCAFCEKHGIKVSNMEEEYFDNPRYQTGTTNLHYYRVNLFNTVIDMQLKELNDRFNETNTQLLICMSCLDPRNSFSAFDIEKLVQLAQFYHSDFNQFELPVLNSQLENYILDVQDDRAFLEVSTILELSEKMVKTNRHNVHPLVYKLVKLGLILPVATASVERAFSAMNIVKTSMRSRMGDQWMNDCLITFIEKDLFKRVSNERIMQRFQNMKARRGILI